MRPTRSCTMPGSPPSGSRRGHAGRGVGAALLARTSSGRCALTKALLPSMRAAGRGRIVVVSSQGGIRGHAVDQRLLRLQGRARTVGRSPGGGDRAVRPRASPSSCPEPSRPTSSPSRPLTTATSSGPYAAHYAGIDRTGRFVVRLASPPERFARALARALDERAPFARHAVGLDARMLLFASRFLPGRLLHHMIRLAMGLPRHGALRGRRPPRVAVDNSPSEESEQHG